MVILYALLNVAKASEKTILANGGVYENTIDVDGKQVKRYWIKV